MSRARFEMDRFWSVQEGVYGSHSWRVRMTGAVAQTGAVYVRSSA